MERVFAFEQQEVVDQADVRLLKIDECRGAEGVGENRLGEALVAVVAVRQGRQHRAALLAQYLRLVPYGNGSHGIAHAVKAHLMESMVTVKDVLVHIEPAPGRPVPANVTVSC